MRIAVWHNLISGGALRALSYHIKALVDKGHYVEVWTSDITVNNKLHAINTRVKTNIVPLKAKLDKLSPPKRLYNQYRFLKKRNSFVHDHCIECADQIHEGNFDIALVSPCSINYMSYLGNYLNIPSALYLQEPYRWNYEALPNLVWQPPNNVLSIKFIKNHIQLINNRIQVYEEIKAAKSYSKILANSLYSRESILKSYGIDSQVCYLPIDDSFFEFPLPSKMAYVVCLGVMYYLKGPDRAIKTIARIPVEHRPKLIWIGNGSFDSYQKTIEKLAFDLNVEIEIKLNIPDKEMFEIVSAAAAMIYMPRLEPFGYAPLEANALGTPVVAIAEGGVRETIIHGTNGLLVYNEDYELAAKYIEKFILNLHYASEFGLECRKFVQKHWSYSNISGNIEMALKAVLKGDG